MVVGDAECFCEMCCGSKRFKNTALEYTNPLGVSPPLAQELALEKVQKEIARVNQGRLGYFLFWDSALVETGALKHFKQPDLPSP